VDQFDEVFLGNKESGNSSSCTLYSLF